MAKRKRTPSKDGANLPHGLTFRQLAFCAAYLGNDGNGSAAAREVGYSPHTAESQASRLLRNAKVRAYLDPRMAARVEKLELRADRLDQELARCAFVDPGKLVDEEGRRLELHELDEDTRRALAGVKFRVAKVVHGKEAQALANSLGASDAARGVEDAPRPVEEVSLGSVEVRLTPKVEAIGLAYKRLGLLKDKLQITGKVRNLSHEEVLLIAQRIRAKKLAGRAGPVGGKPAAPARGQRR